MDGEDEYQDNKEVTIRSLIFLLNQINTVENQHVIGFRPTFTMKVQSNRLEIVEKEDKMDLEEEDQKLICSMVFLLVKQNLLVYSLLVQYVYKARYNFGIKANFSSFNVKSMRSKILCLELGSRSFHLGLWQKQTY